MQINGAIQKFVPTSLQPSLSLQSHHLTFPGHHGKWRLYNPMWREYYWPYVPNDVYTTVIDCHKGACNRPAGNQQSLLQLFSPCSQLRFVSMVDQWSFPKKITGNQLVLVMRLHNSNWTTAQPTSKTTVSHIVLWSMDNWHIPYGIQTHLLTKTGICFQINFVKTLCVFLVLNLLTTAVFHL